MRIYGPVPSRRFGLSLGVDLVPHKMCPFDCIYCQLGPTDMKTSTPGDFFEIDEILGDVEKALEDDPKPDVLTLAGSGEPTLYGSMGELIDGLRELSDIPILLITNSALLWRDDVARAALKADIIAPSLDAGDDEMFQLINKPHPAIEFDTMLAGLADVTRAHKGKVRLEVMLVKGLNDGSESLRRIAGALEKVRFDCIDVNTPVRPPVPERGAMPCDRDALDRAMEIFGPLASPIAAFGGSPKRCAKRVRTFTDLDKDIREMLQRRPCTVEDIASSLGLNREDASLSLERLSKAGLVVSRSTGSVDYFYASGSNPSVVEPGLRR